MAKSYSDFDIDILFDDLWELYPSKVKPSSAKKALTVALRSGKFTPPEIKNAIEVYALETRGDDYHYHFSNFINEDHWQDILSVHRNVDEYKQSLENEEKEAVELIKEWNKACKSHWCKCHSIEARIPMVKKALKNADFKMCWKQALKVAEQLFLKRVNSSHWLGNITLSLKWFCSTASDKHTVIRIIEGEYGKPMEYKPKYHKPPRELSELERDELKRDLEDIFGDKKDDDDFELT